MFYTEEEAAFNRGLVETRVTTFQSRMRHGFPVNDPFLKPHSERSIQSLFFLLVGIIGWLALITPLRAQPAPIFTTARTFDTGPSPGKVAVEIGRASCRER